MKKEHVEEKFTLTKELGKLVRSSDKIVRDDHFLELEKRVVAVSANPAIALTLAEARTLLKK